MVGPIFCSADCNPPCNVRWKYKESNGLKDTLSQNGILLLRSVNRNITQITCSSWWKNESVEKHISLNVCNFVHNFLTLIFIFTFAMFLFLIYILFLYADIDDPIIYVNDEWVSDRIALDIQERKPLHLSCFVNGTRPPTVRIGKSQNGGTVILSEIRDHWSNYSFGTGAQCSDTGTYVVLDSLRI